VYLITKDINFTNWNLFFNSDRYFINTTNNFSFININYSTISFFIIIILYSSICFIHINLYFSFININYYSIITFINFIVYFTKF